MENLMIKIKIVYFFGRGSKRNSQIKVLNVINNLYF